MTGITCFVIARRAKARRGNLLFVSIEGIAILVSLVRNDRNNLLCHCEEGVSQTWQSLVRSIAGIAALVSLVRNDRWEFYRGDCHTPLRSVRNDRLITVSPK